MPSFTAQQLAIVSAIAGGESLAVNAVAGSGKTTTIVEGLRQTTASGIALAFNKKNAEDLQQKIGKGSNVEAKTLNALGHRIWSDHLRRRLAVSTSKTADIIKALGIQFDAREDWVALCKLVSIAKARAISPGLLNRPAPDKDDWLAGAQQIDIPDDQFFRLFDYACEVLKKSVKLAWEGQIDFDDQLYMPVIFDSKFPTYHLVAVDEAQDLSPLQHEMVARLRATQHIVVGDPHQAIYGFRGASESSYEELVEKFSLPVLPLSMSFRCPKTVGHEARHYVPHFECRADAPEGSLMRSHDPAELVSGAVLCRYNAPLIRLAFRAIKAGVPINFLGRDFIAGLKAIHNKAPTPEALSSWLGQRLAEAKTSGAKARAQDQHDSLQVLHTSGRPVPEMLALLSAPSASRIVLSTVHKAKGLEWPHVQFIGYEQSADGGQERNINYVGVTRAQESLVLRT